ncbi:MAG: NUDIX hydrolase [Planctomycetota bacterium]|nr:MAG: NUDIX hydrolase [Planctomycetota bacterium]
MAGKGRYVYEWPRPMVTVDAVVFLKGQGKDKLLLIKRGKEPFKGRWVFPGGFIEMDEELADGAARELAEETHLTGVQLEQMHTFGSCGRDPRGRVISVAFVGTVEPDRATIKAGDDAAEAAWFDIDQLPELAFDHDEIAKMAIGQGNIDFRPGHARKIETHRRQIADKDE